MSDTRGFMGSFKTICGIDVDEKACEDFRKLTGAPAYCMDCLPVPITKIFHGTPPPPRWREATPEISAGYAVQEDRPDVVFCSSIKVASALLGKKLAESPRYRRSTG